MPDTRLLLVRGVRGSGKTHLLHVLRQRETQTPEVWVCPRYFDAGFPFTEYLLSELVRTLLSSEEVEAPVRLQWCARQLAGRLLSQALGTLNPAEWYVWSAAGRLSERTSRRLRTGQRQGLRERLERHAAEQPIGALCAAHGLSPEAAQALVIRQIERSETGTGVAVRMRREVLLAFSESAFRDNSDRIAALLEHDFAQEETSLPPARAEIVTLMLQTLTDILSAINVPVLFAFDNMERLLAPRGTVDEPKAQSFFNGLAHLIDQTRGVLAILLVEHGLWNAFAPAINTFAEHRLRLGVRVRDYGCVWNLELKPPTAEQIEKVVQRRMQPLLARAPLGGQISPLFPFEAEEVQQIATEGVDVLRTALLRLRDRYDAIVLAGGQGLASSSESPAAAAAVPDVPPTVDALQRDWEEAVAAARRRLQASRRTTLTPELHTGLGRWLELLVGQAVGGWSLKDVRSAVAFGEHPTFGVVTIAHWQQGEVTRRVALGPILGEGRSMPKDLEIKLSLFHQRPSLADELVVFWPVQHASVSTTPLLPGASAASDASKRTDYEISRLPAATRQVWEQYAMGLPVSLAPLPLIDFAWLLSFPEWISARSPETPQHELQAFVRQRTEYLLADCAPHPPSEDPS